MGEFGYAPSNEEYTGGGDGGYGYGDQQAGGDFGYGGGYQDEIRSLVPENVPMIAAILMEKGILSSEGLNVALAKQEETGDTLVQVLIDEGLAAPVELVEALQTRANYR